MKKITVSILSLVVLSSMLFLSSVLAAEDLSDGQARLDKEGLAVENRSHVENKGDIPENANEWARGSFGTRGQGLRLEGFQIKLTGDVPEALTIKYNVHVQNKGWLYDEDNFNDWPKNGEFAGTRGEGLRIEAAKFVLVDANGGLSKDYSVQYEGHVQNFGSFPENDPNRRDLQVYYADGQQLGTLGQSLRLEAIRIEID